MALIACKECKEEVSDKAFSCPKCGAQLRKPKRTLFGKIMMFLFVGFNLLMALWVFGGISNGVDSSRGLTGAEQAGHAIGTGIGVTLIAMVWLFGAIILGLFALLTRPKVA